MPSSGNQTENRTEPENPLHALTRSQTAAGGFAPSCSWCLQLSPHLQQKPQTCCCDTNRWVTVTSPRNGRLAADEQDRGSLWEAAFNLQVNEHLQGNLLTLNPNKPICKRYTDKTWHFIQEYHHLINKLWTEYEFVMKYFYNLELNPRMCASNTQRQAHVRKKEDTYLLNLISRQYSE